MLLSPHGLHRTCIGNGKIGLVFLILNSMIARTQRETVAKAGVVVVGDRIQMKEWRLAKLQASGIDPPITIFRVWRAGLSGRFGTSFLSPAPSMSRIRAWC